MQQFEIAGKEYIELNKLLKVLNLVGTGGEANIRIDSGEVKVNGKIENREEKNFGLGMLYCSKEKQYI